VTYSYGCCGVETRGRPQRRVHRVCLRCNGRRVATTDNFNHATLFEYDGNGNQTKVTDALNNETSRPTTC